MESMKNDPFADIAKMMAAFMSTQDKVDMATRHWLNRFKEAVVERRPGIVNEANPDPDLMEELAQTHLDPIKAAREYLLRVYNQPRAEDDTFDLDPFGDTTNLSKKDKATLAAIQILWENDFLAALKEKAPTLGVKLISEFNWDYIDELRKQLLSSKEAAASYIVKLHPELSVPQ